MAKDFRDVPILAEGTPVTHSQYKLSDEFGKGIVLPRTKLLPDWMTLVRFRSDPTRDGRMAVFTDYLER